MKEGREIHILKVVKNIHLDIEILSKATSIMNSINDIFKKLAQEASRVVCYHKKLTIT